MSTTTTTIPQGDADMRPSDDGETAVRICSECEAPRQGEFSEFMYPEAGGYFYPGGSGGGAWHCGTCDTEHGCEAAAGWDDV